MVAGDVTTPTGASIMAYCPEIPENDRRARGPISILAIDIDWFKLYNERYGHPAGNAAVGAVSSAI